jgi:hypothetical protein
MTDHSKIDESATYELIGALFDRRPAGASDFRSKLTGVDRALARRLVVDRLKSYDLSDEDGPVVLAILEAVGVGREKRRLTEIVLSTEGEPRVRMWAAMALSRDDPRMMDLLVTELGPGRMAYLAESALIELITLQSPEQIGATVARALEEWHRDLSATALLDRIESCRRGLGVSCATAYAEALASPRLSMLKGRILDLFVEEASDDGIELLETIRASSQEGTDGRDIQAALLRLRSSQIDPASHPDDARGYAVVSNCDGHGGVIVLGVFENEDETRTISELYILLDGEIHEGVVHPRIRVADLSTLVTHLQMDNHCAFAEATLPEGAALVMTAAARTADEEKRSRGEISRALALFARVRPKLTEEESPPGLESPAVSSERIHTLLTSREYEETWLFDLSELEQLAFPINEDDAEWDRWLDKNSAAIDASPLKRRVTAMAEHMTRWHTWKGEPEQASVCMALAEEIEKSFAHSLLLKVMLKRSLEWMEA